MSAINYLTLLSTIAVTSSGTPVPPGYINIASTNSAPTWSNNISTNGIQGSTIVVSSIRGSTITTSTLSGSTITASTLNASTLSGSTITGSTLTASIINVSTLNPIISNVSSLTASTLSVSTMTGSTLTASIINVSTLNPIISNVSSLVASTLSVSTMTGSTLTASIINVSTLNPIISNVSSLTASTLSVSTMTGSTLTISMLTGLIMSVSSMTSSDLVLSTLTVSSINGLVPGTGSGGGNVSVGTTVFSTLGVSSLNVTSTITTSTMIATGNVGIGSNTPNAPLDVAGQIRTATTATNCIVAMTSGNGSFGSIESFNLGNTSKLPIALNAYGGNIGIGKTNPSQILDVAGAINCTSFLVNGTAVATGSGSVWGVNGSTAYYTSGSVGIGTITPSQRLHVFGDGARIMAESNTGYNAVVQMKTNANTSYLFTDQNGTLQMYGDTGKTVAFMNSNNVGIGVTNPINLLTLQGTGGFTGMIGFNNSGNPVPYVGCGYDQTNDGFAIMLNQGTVFLNIESVFVKRTNGYVGIGKTNPSQILDVAGAINCTSFLVNGTAVATGTGSVWGVSGSTAYYTSGNVGIGIAAPTNPLHINTSAASPIRMEQSGTGPNYLTFKSNGTVYGYFGLENNAGGGLFGSNTAYGMSIGTPTATNFNISTSNLTRMTVASGGNVGIGTASPGNKLSIYSTTANDGILFRNAFNSSTGSIGLYTTSAAGNFIIDGTADAGVVLPADGKDLFLGRTTSLYTSMVVKGGTGRIGIGTATPGGALHINSTTADYSNSLIVNTPWPSIRLGNSSVTGRDWVILNGGSGAGIGIGNFGIFDVTAGTYRLMIDSNGNVGIGNFTSITTKLYVNAGGNVSNGILQFNAGASDADSKTRLSGLANAGLMPSMSGAFFYLYGTNGTTPHRTILSASGYFTGQHANQPIDTDLKTNIQNYVGLIVSSADQGYYSINPITNEIITGSNAITITEALPYIELTATDQDPAVWGVLTNVKNDNLNTDGTTPVDNDEEWGDRLGSMVRVNGLGEGAVWVTNINGNIRNGDLICSSMIPGYGRKQNDDLFHSYTVAKATMSCNFDLSTTKYQCKTITHDGTEYIAVFIGCSYHCS